MPIQLSNSHGHAIEVRFFCLSFVDSMASKKKSIAVILLLITSCLISYSAQTSDTLKQSDTLNSTQSLISANGNFTLGFFKLPSSRNGYLAIWYTGSPGEPVWIANRNTPVHNDSGILTIQTEGKLVINRIGGDPIELYSNETSNANNTSATLLDSGNFVLRLLNSDGSQGKTLWQSFDYPTDTLLPGMKLGISHTLSNNWSLTSWLSQSDPSSGPYTLEWDPRMLQLRLMRRGVVFWTSGQSKNQSFEHMIEADSNLVENYNMTHERNSDEEFFSYSLKQDHPASGNHRELKWRIGFRGTIWFEDAGLPLENICYGYNTDRGCAEWTQPECRSDKPIFVTRSGFFRGLTPNDSNYQNFNKDKSLGPGDCRSICWNDCDCLGYMKNSSNGCIMWRGQLQFEPDSSKAAPDIFIISNQTDTADGNNQGRRARRKKWIWVAAAVPSLIVACVAVIIFLLWRKQKGDGEKKNLARMTRSNRLGDATEFENDGSIDGNLKVFCFESISEATNNFSEDNKLGEGGFGPVFKGTFPGGCEIAVKQLSSSSSQGLVEFKNELMVIAKLQHMNLVRLIGYCIEGAEKMLVYEYMPNRSLDSFLFDPSKRGLLDWRKRVHIVEGIAQGLLYLHQHSRLKIIHRDLKASNILLDADMNPRISDFGMARIFKQSELIAITHKVVGTYGYMPPEYGMQGIFSVKSDIFSFGVLMLEIVSGKRNNSFHDNNGPLNLVGYAWDLWQRGDEVELMDPMLKYSCNTTQLVRYIHVGLLCVEDSPADRPTISEAITMITNERNVLPMLKKPAFLNLSTVINVGSQGNELENHSVNGFSTSIVYAR